MPILRKVEKKFYSMSKKNTKSKKHSFYKHYKYDKLLAMKWNESAYDTWLIMDEGQERPDPMRFTNFLFKYGTPNKRTGTYVLQYIEPDIKERYIYPWVKATTSERKELRKLFPLWEKVFIKTLHLAEMKYLDSIEK